ncbi:hypothetical protein K439DRAFT_1333331 [Ramaria rubella]|nr:hypothetical protein K439DRAFT_1333331 [Ramaria rubella]
MPPAPSLNTFDSSHISPAASPAASTTSFTIPEITNHSNPPSPGHTSIDHLSSQSLVDEITHLRGRVRDLEFINDLVRIRVAELESAADSKSQVHRELGLGLELASDDSGPSSYPASTSDSARNSITPGFDFLNRDLGPPPADWHLRTQARLKRFCALNRAGNALCAWHDSRRERRAFPPRMAPPQTLNCGCTYSEALFEESLARNGVGAFYPGENVRMDPALRNPLLKLLEERYGYRDGDFERTPEGRWRENEDGLSWEHKASHSGGPRRRDR